MQCLLALCFFFHFHVSNQLCPLFSTTLDCSLPGLSVPWSFPRNKNTRVGCEAGGGWQPPEGSYSGLACGSRARLPPAPLQATQPCLPALSLCQGSHLTSLPSPSGWDLGAEPCRGPRAMQCQLLWGLAGVLLTLLCMGLLSLRYHSSLSPQRVPKTLS